MLRFCRSLSSCMLRFCRSPPSSFQSLLEPLDEVVHFGFAEAEWWKKAKDIGARATSEAMQFFDEAITHLLVRDVEFHANHQTTSAHVNHMRKMSRLELVDQIIAHFSSIFHQMLAFHHVEDSESSCTSKMVATESRAELSIHTQA